ncbi:MAG: glycerol kinase GlpK [Candidatus Omnitrophica bacterium]|nr:glycerol kinase GlpK [Candidatus Omnitrophota bacterium]
MRLLALDLGTTGNRAIVFDRDQNILGQAYEEFPQIYPRPGWVEHDPEAIWKGVRRVLKKTFLKIPASSIAAAGITNQRETVLLWDKATGRPIHNAIVWQCRRTADFCERLKKSHGDSIHQKTGLVLDAYFSASKIRWLLDHVPGARKKAENGRLLAGTIDTWVIWKLSGGLHVTDSSNASRTMLFNIHDKKWDESLCRLFGIPLSILPKVVPSSFSVGVTDKKITGAPIPIAGIVGDQQGASFAQGCFSPGVVKNTYGTGLFMVENTGKTPRFSKNLLTTVAWSLGNLDRTEYAIEGSVFIGGAAIQWLRDGLKIIQNAGESEKVAKRLSGNEGVYFVPALVGLGSPYWDSRARGLMIGITRGTTRAHLVRAALESIAYQTRDVMEVMKKDARAPFRVLRVDGGAAANDFLMQFQADILGIPVERSKIIETTALGAAGLAGLAVGAWKNKEAFNRARRVDRVFKPRRLAQKEFLYKQWKDAVKRSQSWA